MIFTYECYNIKSNRKQDKSTIVTLNKNQSKITRYAYFF